MTIEKVKIENHSTWPMIRCVQAAAQIMELEKDYIQENRKIGATFLRTDGISIGVLPICPDAPADTLSFHFMDAPDAAEKCFNFIRKVAKRKNIKTQAETSEFQKACKKYNRKDKK